MFSISESLYADLHLLSFEGIRELFNSFTQSFPFSMDLLVSKRDYDRMVEDARGLAGEEHPECSTQYNSKEYLWSEYHPLNNHVYKNGDILLQTKIGFVSREAAMLFKLKWFQS